MSTYTCAITGEESGLKHYVLKTTEGDELISADALINPVKFLKEIARDWGQLRNRVERLEQLLVEAADVPDGADDGKEPTAAAAPAKKAAAKKVPAPRDESGK